MSKVITHISMSLDGFIAGPNPTLEEPLGQGGEQLHDWGVKLKSWREAHGMSGGETGPDDEVMKKSTENVGAVIMGRKMYSGGEGPWEDDPNPDGWWGDTPPFHVPVFVLTHHQREEVVKEGGTTFIFVTSGIEVALNKAREAAGDKNISVAGGANAIQQVIQAKALDELNIHLAPIILGGGTRLLENLGAVTLEKLEVIDASALVTHFKFGINYD